MSQEWLGCVAGAAEAVEGVCGDAVGLGVGGALNLLTHLAVHLRSVFQAKAPGGPECTRSVCIEGSERFFGHFWSAVKSATATGVAGTGEGKATPLRIIITNCSNKIQPIP